LKVSKYLLASNQAVEGRKYFGFRVLVAVGTTSAASSAGAERGFFLKNIIKTKQKYVNFMQDSLMLHTSTVD